MVKVVVAVLAGLAIIVGGLWLLQRRLIYLPARDVPPRGSQLAAWWDVAIPTQDGLHLAGWYAPPGETAPVVVVFNGNAGNRGDRTELGASMAAEGFGVLLFDYRGYGGNRGSPTEKGLARNARAVAAWVQAESPGNPVVYFGESLGAAVAVELASVHPPVALILRSPFTSLGDVAAAHYWFLPVRTMLWDEYPALDHIATVAVPTLVIAGSADTIVPVEHSKALFNAAAGEKQLLIIPGADHNDPALAAGSDVVAATASFIRTAIEP